MTHKFFPVAFQLCLLAAYLVPLPRSWADEPIKVELASRRTFVARVDPRTDEARLWLRFENGRSFMLRSVAWDSVLTVRQGKRVLDIDDVLALATYFQPPPMDDLGVEPFETAHRRSHNDATVVATNSDGKVRWLSIDAWYGKWTPDVGVDGLLVEVIPRNAAGEIVPVRGTLEVELFAFRQKGIQRVRHPRRIGRWQVMVAAGDFGAYGAVVPLRFQSFHPQRDQTIEPNGLVHARFSVPGQGTFEASRADVELRPYSAFRDRLDIETGHRFLSGEQVPRGVR